LVQAKSKYVQCHGLKKPVPLHPIVGRHDLQSVTSLRESPSVAGSFDFTERCYRGHHLLCRALRASGRRDDTGKIYFDEVHYVPAARQMFELVMPAPMLDPMHPLRARRLMARSIRTFRDAPLDWRYPSVLERVPDPGDAGNENQGHSRQAVDGNIGRRQRDRRGAGSIRV
jgi:hypothetical protein